MGANIASMIIITGDVGHPQFQSIILVVTVVLRNAMACKVFRVLKFSVLDQPDHLSDNGLGMSLRFTVVSVDVSDVESQTAARNDDGATLFKDLVVVRAPPYLGTDMNANSSQPNI